MTLSLTIKRKWIDALRSGQYQQTRKCLNDGVGMCCLGVLTDLYIKETGQGVWIPGDTLDDGRAILTFVNNPEVETLDDAIARIVEDDDGRVEIQYFETEFTELPRVVNTWAGLLPLGAEIELVTLNDGVKAIDAVEPKTFAEIADYIEQKL